MIDRVPFQTHFHFFFFNDTATTEIYTLSLHDALPILKIPRQAGLPLISRIKIMSSLDIADRLRPDRKSTRLNSSHDQISYAVFCLKKKNYHYCQDSTYHDYEPYIHA